MNWTAFKTTAKVGVKGTFKSVKIEGASKAKPFAKLIEGINVTIDQSTVDTNNPARDKTLSDFFFSQIKAGITGKIKKVSETKKTWTLVLSLNGKSKEIPMDYTLENNSLLTAKGQLSILDFDGANALQSINQKCYDLHKGPDGVSKTWPDVALEIQATLTPTCK